YGQLIAAGVTVPNPFQTFGAFGGRQNPFDLGVNDPFHNPIGPMFGLEPGSIPEPVVRGATGVLIGGSQALEGTADFLNGTSSKFGGENGKIGNGTLVGLEAGLYGLSDALIQDMNDVKNYVKNGLRPSTGSYTAGGGVLLGALGMAVDYKVNSV